MSYKDWQEENKGAGLATDPAGGFTAWKQQSQKMGVLPPQQNYSAEEVDFAYEQYRRTVDKGMKIFTRQAFEKITCRISCFDLSIRIKQISTIASIDSGQAVTDFEF